MQRFKITIFDKFIFSQVFQATLVCLLLFIIVWIAPETLVRSIRQIFLEHMPTGDALMNIVYELPKVLSKALPVGILLGSIFTFDKLSKDSELAILRGIGLSFNRIMVPVLVLGAAFSIICFVVTDKLIPMASAASREDAGYNEHFVYIQKDQNERPRQGVIVSNYSSEGMKNLIIINFAVQEYDDVIAFKSVLFAPTALLEDDKWVLPEAKEYRISRSGVYEAIKDVKNYPVLIGTDAKDAYALMQNATKRERAFTNAQLFSYLKLLKSKKYEDEHNFFLSKYYQRFLHPLTCILFAALGCLLGFSPPRSQRLIGFTVAVGFIFIYYITLPFFDLLAEKGVVFPVLAASTPILGFVASIFAVKKIKDL